MKKYYYECPIQALYMNKEFGVEFVDCIDDYIDFFNYWITYADDIKKSREVFESFCCEISVSEESNHIFEPKDWDLTNEQPGEIIMRDGKHFFMPKVIED